jgi:glycosyltransferase involved in cell wall biosynthesis
MSARGPVVHLVPALFGTADGIVGGAERYAFELAKHMAREVETRLLTFGRERRDGRFGALQVRVLGPAWHVRGQVTNPLAPGLAREILRAGVVHCHQTHVISSTTAAAICRLTGKPVFTTDLGGGGWDLSAYVSTDRWYHGHLHLSEYSRRVHGHDTEAWAHVISGGVDTDRFSPDASVPRSDTMLFVGRLLPHKGIDDLIQAATPDMDVEIIGRVHDPAYFRSLQALAAAKRVTFRQDCDDEQLVHAYRRARCVVLPSVYRPSRGAATAVPELLGQALLEAMACGAPAVGSDAASLPEIIEHERTGFVVPAGDVPALRARLQWLRSHPAEAAAIGAHARRRVLDRFNWPAVVRRCLEIYSQAA